MQNEPLRRLRILQTLAQAPGIPMGLGMIARQASGDPEIDADAATVLTDIRYLAAFGLVRENVVRLADGDRITATLTMAGDHFLSGHGVEVAGVMRPMDALDEAIRDVLDPNTDTAIPLEED